MKSWDIHNLEINEYIKNHQSKYRYLEYAKIKEMQDKEAQQRGFKNYKELLEYEEEHWEPSMSDVL